MKEGQAPKRVKLFVNRPSLGFDEAENEQGVQEFEVKGGKEGEKVDLRLVKFQGVQSLHVRSLFLRCSSFYIGPAVAGVARADRRFFAILSNQIFIMSNQGDEDVTRVDSIEVFGEAMDATSNGPLQKVDDGHGH